MAELDQALVLRATNQLRTCLREAGDIIRNGPQAALSAGMVHRNAGERIERAMRLCDGLVAHLQGVAGPANLAPEPPSIIGPVVPSGGETRRLYLLEHPDVALDEERARQAAAAEAPPEIPAASRSIEEIVATAVASALEKAFVAKAIVASGRPATPEETAHALAVEQRLAAEPEPPAFTPPADFGRTDLEEAIEEDALVDQLTGGVGVTVQSVTAAPVGPDPTRPGWFPPGKIPPGVPIPHTPSTFRPFEELDGAGIAHVTITREELDRLEAAAAERDGRPYRPLPPTAPGIVTDDPAEYERVLAQRGVRQDFAEAAPTIAAVAETLQAPPAPDDLDAATAAAHTDKGELVLPCRDCGMQAKKWVGLMGHAVAKHDFKGTMAELKEWARGSSSSAA